jgi:hypothetical protein
MAIGPSDRNRDLPATFETNPIAASAPARGRSGAQRPAPTGAAPTPPPSRPAGAVSTALGAMANSAQSAGPVVAPLAPVLSAGSDIAAGRMPSALQPGGSMGLLAPGLSARERGNEFREGVKGIGRDLRDSAVGAYNTVASAADAVVRPAGEFLAGAVGIEPAKPSVRDKFVAAQQARRAAGGAGSNPRVEIAPAPTSPAIQAAVPGAPVATPQPAPGAAAQTPVAGDNGSYFIGSDGVRRAVSTAPNGPPSPATAPPPAPGGPVAITQPVAPPALAPSSVSRVDPSRSRAGDEATANAMREIESQMFRNSLRGNKRSVLALQGQLAQALAGLAPTLGNSADAADARNVQARTALAQTQAQQQAAALQAGAAQNIAAQRSEAAQRVAEIATGGRPPQLLPTTGGLMRLGPDGQAMPVTGPDGQPVQLSGGGQGIRPDTLFKEFNGRIAAIQADATLSPEVKQQQMAALYSDPLFQGLAPYLMQPGQQ